MGIGICQYRVAIGAFHGGRRKEKSVSCVSSRTARFAFCTDRTKGCRWVSAALLFTLLVIGGLEVNPGPNASQSARNMNTRASSVGSNSNQTHITDTLGTGAGNRSRNSDAGLSDAARFYTKLVCNNDGNDE